MGEDYQPTPRLPGVGPQSNIPCKGRPSARREAHGLAIETLEVQRVTRQRRLVVRMIFNEMRTYFMITASGTTTIVMIVQTITTHCPVTGQGIDQRPAQQTHAQLRRKHYGEGIERNADTRTPRMLPPRPQPVHRAPKPCHRPLLTPSADTEELCCMQREPVGPVSDRSDEEDQLIVQAREPPQLQT